MDRKSSIICFNIFLFLLGITPVFANAEKIKCNGDGNQQEMNACARDNFERADKELNQTYLAIIKKEENNPHFIEKLRTSQKAWLIFRDAELDAFFADCSLEDSSENKRSCNGSMYPMSLFSYKTELTQNRIYQLKRILRYGHGEFSL